MTAVLALVLVVPGAAVAASVEVSLGAAALTSASGDDHTVHIWHNDPDEPGDEILMKVSGTADPVSIGAGCRMTNEGWFACAGATRVAVSLGAGDDIVKVQPPPESSATAPFPLLVSVSGADGDDTITGGAGPDELSGGAGCNTMDGASGDDRLWGEGTLRGGPGADQLTGYGALDGGPEDDDVTVREPEECPLEPWVLLGGPGDDDIRFDLELGVDVSLDGIANDGHWAWGAANTGQVAGFEGIRGTRDDDRLVGGPGTRRISGGEGYDDLTGGTGGEVIDGGPDDDTLTYETRTTPVTVDQDNTADDGEAGEGDNVSRVEELIGGSADDDLALGVRGGRLVGGPGDDILTGSAGDDGSVSGGPTQTGWDVIEGGPGDDTLRGLAYEDVLYGGPGADVLEGGAGDDTLVGEDYAPNEEYAADSYDGGTGDDDLWMADGIPELGVCGPGVDLVQADATDRIADDCELGRRAPEPPPPAPSGWAPVPSTSGGSSGPRPYFDSVAPILAVDRIKPLRLRRLPARIRFKLRCSEPCNTGATLTVKVRSGRKLQRRVVGRGRVLVGPSGWTSLTLRPTAAQRRLLRRASGSAATLELVADDVIGNRTVRRFRVPLRARG